MYSHKFFPETEWVSWLICAKFCLITKFRKNCIFYFNPTLQRKPVIANCDCRSPMWRSIKHIPIKGTCAYVDSSQQSSGGESFGFFKSIQQSFHGAEALTNHNAPQRAQTNVASMNCLGFTIYHQMLPVSSSSLLYYGSSGGLFLKTCWCFYFLDSNLFSLSWLLSGFFMRKVCCGLSFIWQQLVCLCWFWLYNKQVIEANIVACFIELT